MPKDGSTLPPPEDIEKLNAPVRAAVEAFKASPLNAQLRELQAAFLADPVNIRLRELQVALKALREGAEVEPEVEVETPPELRPAEARRARALQEIEDHERRIADLRREVAEALTCSGVSPVPLEPVAVEPATMQPIVAMVERRNDTNRAARVLAAVYGKGKLPGRFTNDVLAMLNDRMLADERTRGLPELPRLDRHAFKRGKEKLEKQRERELAGDTHEGPS
jgi:hypothetical protein